MEFIRGKKHFLISADVSFVFKFLLVMSTEKKNASSVLAGEEIQEEL